MTIDRVCLIAEMAKRRMTVRELAEKASISRVTITAIRGGKACAENTAQQIAEALGVAIDDLVTKEV